MIKLNERAIEEGTSAYLRYCNGIWIIQDPSHASELMGQVDMASDEGLAEVVGCAEDLLQHGARKFLEASLSEEMVSLTNMRDRYAEVFPRANQLLKTVVANERERLDDMNHAYWRLRPAAFLQSSIFVSLAHGSYDKITTIKMLDDFKPHRALGNILTKKRTLRTRTLGAVGLFEATS